LPDVSVEEQTRAKAMVAAALRAQPATASSRELDDVRDAVLAPFHASIAKARADEQARVEAEARRMRERNYRDSLAQPLRLLVYDLSGAEGDEALAAIREALDALPEGTPEHDLAAARDRAIRSCLDARTQRRRNGH